MKDVTRVAGIDCKRCYTMGTYDAELEIDRATHDCFVAAHGANEEERLQALRKLGVLKKDDSAPGQERFSCNQFKHLSQHLCLVLTGCSTTTATGGISFNGHDTICSCRFFWPNQGMCSHEVFVRGMNGDDSVDLGALGGPVDQTVPKITPSGPDLLGRPSLLPPGSHWQTLDSLKAKADAAKKARAKRAAKRVASRSCVPGSPTRRRVAEQGPQPKFRDAILGSIKKNMEECTPDSVDLALTKALSAKITRLEAQTFGWFESRLVHMWEDSNVSAASKVMIRMIWKSWGVKWPMQDLLPLPPLPPLSPTRSI